MPYMGVIFIIMGFFLCFWGNDFINIVIFMVVTMALSMVGLELTFKITTNSTSNWVNWVILICVCLLASAAGTFAVKNRKLGITLISLFAGFFFGMTLATPFSSKLGGGAFWGISIGTAVLFGIVSYWLETALIIITTSFVGAYMLVRGASTYIKSDKW